MWSAPNVSPFLTARAAARAPLILTHAAAGGAAMLIAPDATIVLSAGERFDADLAAIAAGVTRRPTSFRTNALCIHAVHVVAGWTLCALSTPTTSPGPILERLRRASAVMRLALLDGAPQRPGGSAAPAATRV